MYRLSNATTPSHIVSQINIQVKQSGCLHVRILRLIHLQDSHGSHIVLSAEYEGCIGMCDGLIMDLQLWGHQM